MLRRQDKNKKEFFAKNVEKVAHVKTTQLLIGSWELIKKLWHKEEGLSHRSRQRLTRKKSTDVASRRKYMDDDDEDEEDEGDDDEVFAGSDEGDAAENGNASRLRGGCQICN